jgi:hypothetical protein
MDVRIDRGSSPTACAAESRAASAVGSAGWSAPVFESSSTCPSGLQAAPAPVPSVQDRRDILEGSTRRRPAQGRRPNRYRESLPTLLPSTSLGLTPDDTVDTADISRQSPGPGRSGQGRRINALAERAAAFADGATLAAPQVAGSAPGRTQLGRRGHEIRVGAGGSRGRDRDRHVVRRISRSRQLRPVHHRVRQEGE